mgnify:CR=1 FL=1
MDFMFWNPREYEQPKEQVPVTVLCGFLGAGKTTLLNRLLTAFASRKIAVLVNDLGEVNIDASLIKGTVKELDGSGAEILELQGGCICCSIQTDLLDALLELRTTFQPEHILIEATGVAEPSAILETLYSANFFGWRGTDFLKIANMITVIDGGNLEQYFDSPENTGASRRTHLLLSDQRNPLQELLMEQIECADILLINKTDALSDSARQRIRARLASLNGESEVWECSFGNIEVERLMEDFRFSEEKTLAGAAWRQVIIDNKQGRKNEWKRVEENDEGNLLVPHVQGGHSDSFGDLSHKDDYGLETYVFNARRPFQENLFLKVLRTGLPGVIRAKGFYWTDRSPDKVGLFSIAGKMMRADYLSEWWQTKLQRGEVTLEEMPEVVRESWLPVFGDRRQELVFIGIDLDRKRIEKALMECFSDVDVSVS